MTSSPATTPIPTRAEATPAHTGSLECLGTGDGWSNPDRSHSAYLYELGPTRLLVDCGEPVSRSLKATGREANDVDHIFLSHLHFDHVGGLFMLLQGLWLEGRTRELTLHLPAEGIAPIRQMLDAGYIFEELLQFPLRWAPLTAGRPIPAGPVRVTPFANSHLANLRRDFQQHHPARFEAFSFLFECGDLRIAHSADLGDLDDLDQLLAQPLDLLVCELAHLDPESLFRRLRHAPVQRVLFVHLTRPLWEDLEGTMRRAKQGLGELPFDFARDGQVLALGPGHRRSH